MMMMKQCCEKNVSTSRWPTKINSVPQDVKRGDKLILIEEWGNGLMCDWRVAWRWISNKAVK
jgi:hypothetical protein